jgi:hypothetical protein
MAELTDGLSFPVSQTSLSLGDLPRSAPARAYMASINVPQESPSLALSSRDPYSTSAERGSRVESPGGIAVEGST